MESYISQQRDHLYGVDRNRHGEELKEKLTTSSLMRNGDWNINKSSDTPGFQWSTVTLDDYKRVGHSYQSQCLKYLSIFIRENFPILFN